MCITAARSTYICYLGLLIATVCWKQIDAVAIDNDIAGEPNIECLEDKIRISVNTRKVFAGRLYAKSRATEPACVKSGFVAYRTTQPQIDMPLGICGMKSVRSTDPRGMFYGITIVVSFHPIFITKVDKAFHVKCFFEEANRGLTAELGVSMIPTTEANAFHGVPGCTYSIHRATIFQLDQGYGAGPPITYAQVGDKILHKWECVDPMFGVLVKNCYVTDGLGQRAEVMNDQGCPLDPILITGIRYAANLSQAYAESHVFKFADTPGIWFFCQIQMCMKNVGLCQGVTPPSCGQGGNQLPAPTGSPINPSSPSGGSYVGQTTLTPNAPGVTPRAQGVEKPNFGDDRTGQPRLPIVENEVKEASVQPNIALVFDAEDKLGVGVDGQKSSPSDEFLNSNLPPISTTTQSQRGRKVFNPSEFSPPTVATDNSWKNTGEDGEKVYEVRVTKPTQNPQDNLDRTPFPTRRRNFLNTGDLDSTGPTAAIPPVVGGVTQQRNLISNRPITIADRINLTAAQLTNFPSLNPSQASELSGQLIIYDIDEEPPNLQLISKSSIDDTYGPGVADSIRHPTCVVSTQVFIIIISSLGGVVLLLLTIICVLCAKRTSRGHPKEPPIPTQLRRHRR